MLHNQYMSNSITEIFKIDKVGKGIAVKLIFTFLIFARASLMLFPDEAFDFKPLEVFYRKYLENPQLAYSMNPEDVPLSDWNCILICFVVFLVYLYIMAFAAYVGLFIRHIRVTTGKGKAATMSDIVTRLTILALVVPVFYIPFIIFMLYLILFLIIIFPWLIMYPACYLSGDHGLIASVSEMYRKTRGYYLINVRNICIILTVSFMIRMLTTLLSEAAPAAAFTADTFADTFILLCLARYVGLIYIKMIEAPFGIARRPVTNSDNDARPS